MYEAVANVLELFRKENACDNSGSEALIRSLIFVSSISLVGLYNILHMSQVFLLMTESQPSYHLTPLFLKSIVLLIVTITNENSTCGCAVLTIFRPHVSKQTDMYVPS